MVTYVSFFPRVIFPPVSMAEKSSIVSWVIAGPFLILLIAAILFGLVTLGMLACTIPSQLQSGVFNETKGVIEDVGTFFRKLTKTDRETEMFCESLKNGTAGKIRRAAIDTALTTLPTPSQILGSAGFRLEYFQSGLTPCQVEGCKQPKQRMASMNIVKGNLINSIDEDRDNPSPVNTEKDRDNPSLANTDNRSLINESGMLSGNPRNKSDIISFELKKMKCELIDRIKSAILFSVMKTRQGMDATVDAWILKLYTPSKLLFYILIILLIYVSAIFSFFCIGLILYLPLGWKILSSSDEDVTSMKSTELGANVFRVVCYMILFTLWFIVLIVVIFYCIASIPYTQVCYHLLHPDEPKSQRVLIIFDRLLQIGDSVDLLRMYVDCRQHGILYIKKDANVTWNVDKIMDFDSIILNKSSIKVPVAKQHRIVHNSSLFKSKDYGSTDPSRRFEDVKMNASIETSNSTHLKSSKNHTRTDEWRKSLEFNDRLKRHLNESRELKVKINSVIKAIRNMWKNEDRRLEGPQPPLTNLQLNVMPMNTSTVTNMNASNAKAYVMNMNTSNASAYVTHLNSSNLKSGIIVGTYQTTFAGSGSLVNENVEMSRPKKFCDDFIIIVRSMIDLICLDTVYPMNGYWFATAWCALLLTIVFAVSHRLAGLNFGVTEEQKKALFEARKPRDEEGEQGQSKTDDDNDGKKDKDEELKKNDSLSVEWSRVGLGGFKPTHFQKRHP